MQAMGFQAIYTEFETEPITLDSGEIQEVRANKFTGEKNISFSPSQNLQNP